jgi:alkaline phosphatase D
MWCVVGRWRHGLVLIAAVASGLVPARAVAELSACGESVARAVETYAAAKWRILGDCEQRRARGATSANCRPDAGPVTDRRTARRLAVADRTADTQIRLGCGFLPHAGPTCHGARDVVACLVSSVPDPDPHVVGIDRLFDVARGAGGTIADRALRTCRNAIADAAGQYVQARLLAAHTCATAEISGQGTPCPSGAMLAAFGAARTAFEQAVRASCTDEQADAGTLDLGAPCDRYALASFQRIAVPGDPNTNTILVLDRLLHCLAAAVADTGDRLASFALTAPRPRPFVDGVAAGDVTDTGGVFWTRLPAPNQPALLDVSTSPDFVRGRTFAIAAAAGDDGTVKREVSLRPATTYFYRFRQRGAVSLVGQVRTPPDPSRPADVVLGWSGGSDPYLRPFAILDQLRTVGVDAFLYTGDTIFADDARADGVVATTFAAFTRKYRLGRRDPALRNLLASTATFAQWNDRETATDAAGAEPAFVALLADANHAFRRYFPVRDDAQDPVRLYRSVRWGSLVEVFLLDARQYRSAKIVCCTDGTIAAVTAPGPVPCSDAHGGVLVTPDAACVAGLADPSRTVLGAAQKAWLENALAASAARFKLVMNGPAMASSPALPYDRWEDYPVERTELLDFVRDRRINVVWLTTAADGVFVSTPGVDADHRVPEATAGPLAASPFLRTLPASAAAVPASVPELFPSVTRFELDRANVVLITISEAAGLASAKLDFRDAAGQSIQTVTFRAAQ